MENNQQTNKNRKKNKKSHTSQSNKKHNVWKILNEHDTTTDQDSDGTTGSVGGHRTRDSSECSSSITSGGKKRRRKSKRRNASPIVVNNNGDDIGAIEEGLKEESDEIPPSITESKLSNSKRNRIRQRIKLNYIHRNNEKINSLLNALLMASILIVSGLASGHYIATHTRFPQRVPTNIFNRYVSRTVEMYERLLEENVDLRDRIEKLEHTLNSNISKNKTNADSSITNEQIEQEEKEILHSLMKLVDKEMNTMFNVLEATATNLNDEITENKNDKNRKMPDNEYRIKIKSNVPSSTDYQEHEREFDRMIEQGKALQHRLKRKNLIKDENIAKNDEKIKNNQVDATIKSETFFQNKERVIDTLADADYVIADCEKNNQNQQQQLQSNMVNLSKPKINKNGYVYNIRKLFEPNGMEDGVCSIDDEISAKSFGDKEKSNEINQEQKDEDKSEQHELEINLSGSKVSKGVQENFIGPINEENKLAMTNDSTDLENKCDAAYELTESYLTDKKADIRESKRRPKSRSTERGRPRRKIKHNRDNKQLIEDL